MPIGHLYHSTVKCKGFARLVYCPGSRLRGSGGAVPIPPNASNAHCAGVAARRRRPVEEGGYCDGFGCSAPLFGTSNTGIVIPGETSWTDVQFSIFKTCFTSNLLRANATYLRSSRRTARLSSSCAWEICARLRPTERANASKSPDAKAEIHRVGPQFLS